MPEGQQTLTDASVEVADGKTVVTFTKIMKEDGEIEVSTGDNKFLAAYGAGNELAYHGKSRTKFEFNLSEGTPEEEASELEPEPAAPEPAPEVRWRRDENATTPRGFRMNCFIFSNLFESILFASATVAFLGVNIFVSRSQINLQGEPAQIYGEIRGKVETKKTNSQRSRYFGLPINFD